MKLQGRNNPVSDLMSAVRAVQRKLGVFQLDIQDDIVHKSEQQNLL